MRGANLFIDMESAEREFIHEKWFKPIELYKNGFPKGFASYVQILPGVKKKIIETVHEIKCESALEIGPGAQPVIKDVPKHIFLDISKYFLNGQEITRGTAFLGKAEKLPFKDNSFDVVVANDVLVHMRLQDRIVALKEMARVSKGRIIIFEHESITEDGKMLNRNLSTTEDLWIDLEQLKETMKEAGIVPLHVNRYFYKGIEKENNLKYLITAEIITAIKV